MDYFSRNRDRPGSSSQFPTIASSSNNHNRRPSNGSSNPDTDVPRVQSQHSRPSSSQAIRLRRLSSMQSVQNAREQQQREAPQIPLPSPLAEADERASEPNRRRSTSEPQRPSTFLPNTDLHRLTTTGGFLSPLNEEPSTANLTPSAPVQHQESHGSLAPPATRPEGRIRRASTAMASALSGRRSRAATTETDRPSNIPDEPHVNNYESEVVDLLDVIDPEVSTLTTLNNLQNSLFVPNLGRFLNRTPTYNLTWHDPRDSPPPETASSSDQDDRHGSEVSEEKDLERVETPLDTPGELMSPDEEGAIPTGRRLKRSHTITSQLSNKSGEGHNYAVLPHGVRLEGWSEQEKDELDDHVRHLLHSKREGFKRSMRAFGKYVRTPLGAFVTIYAFLVTFWGAAWVFFLIGWIYVGDRQAYFVEICDQILTALFAVVGDGLAPFRAVDTYHMIFIAKYHYKTWSERKRRGLPELEDPNDLPEYANHLRVSQPGSGPSEAHLPVIRQTTAEGRHSQSVDIEDAATSIKDEDFDAEAVLTPKEYISFKKHQAKFQKSHTFYRPHETFTHHAFPIKLLITTVVLLDFHSIFQIVLGGTTWGIYYKHRPKALTAVILTCSICCNIAGGIVISVGDKKTRKKEVVETMFRQSLTEEAMRRMHRKKGLKVPDRMQKGKEAKKKQKQYDANVARELAQEVPKQSIDVRRSMDARRSLDAKRSLDTKRAMSEASAVPEMPRLKQSDDKGHIPPDLKKSDARESLEGGTVSGLKTATELAKDAMLRAAEASIPGKKIS